MGNSRDMRVLNDSGAATADEEEREADTDEVFFRASEEELRVEPVIVDRGVLERVMVVQVLADGVCSVVFFRDDRTGVGHKTGVDDE